MNLDGGGVLLDIGFENADDTEGYHRGCKSSGIIFEQKHHVEFNLI